MSDRPALLENTSLGYHAVFSAVSSFQPNSVLRTSTIIRRAREIAPTCLETDEQLIRHLLEAASGRTMAVCFDGEHAAGRVQHNLKPSPDEIRSQALRTRRAVEAILNRQRHRLVAESGEQ